MKIRIDNNYLKANSIIVLIFLFQYSLSIPLLTFFSAPILVALISSILVFFSLLVNYNKSVDRTVVGTLLLVFFAVICKLFVYTDDALYILGTITSIIVPVAVVLCHKFDSRYFTLCSFKFAIINFIFISWIPFLGNYEYMRFGYGMLLTVVFLYIKCFMDTESKTTRRSIDYIILIIAIAEMVIYGARGAFLSFLLFVVIDRLVINRKRILQNFCLVIGGGVIFALLEKLLVIMEILVEKLGVPAYAIKKYRMQLKYGLAVASSNRNNLYSESIDKIKNHIYLGGKIDFIEREGETYSHNLFLQAGVDFGFLGIIVVFLCIFLIMNFIKNNDNNRYERYVLSAIFSISIGRLLVSSVVWKRPEFWMMICMFCLFKRKQC